MLVQPRLPATVVPFIAPPVSFLKLQDYIKSLSYVVYWPLDDVANNPFNRVFNPAVAAGRELIINGNFSLGTNWTLGTGFSISGGQLVATAVAAGQNATQPPPVNVGRAYRISFDCTVSAGSFRLQTIVTGATISASGTYSVDVVIVGTTLGFLAVTTFTGTIDNVSVKELNIPAHDATLTNLFTNPAFLSGVTGWTVDNTAVLTSITTTPHASGTNYLHVVTTGANGGAKQTGILTIGQTYRIFGVVRADGSRIPIILNGATQVNTSAFNNLANQFQAFDYTFIAVSADITLRTQTNSGFTDWFPITIALWTGLRTDSFILANGDMELNDLNYWPTSNNPTVTYETASPHSGSRHLRVQRNATNLAQVLRNGSGIAGVRQWIHGWFRGDGTANARVTVAGNTISSTTSTSWQEFNLVYFETSSVGQIGLQCNGTATGQWADFDDITITELPPLVALPVNGLVLGNTETNRLIASVLGDGANDAGNIYSLTLNSVWTPAAFTVSFFAKIVSGLTDGSNHFLFGLQGGGSTDQVLIFKTATNNQIGVTWRGTNASKQVLTTLSNPTLWHHYAMTVDIAADQMKLYIDGVQVGSTQTGLTAWTPAGNNLTGLSCVFLATNTAGSSGANANMSHLVIGNGAWSLAQISEIAKLGDTF